MRSDPTPNRADTNGRADTSVPGEFDDVAWAAMQYLLGELSGTESDAFEQRMEADQSAREALTQAVGLAETIVAAEAPSPNLAAAPVTPGRLTAGQSEVRNGAAGASASVSWSAVAVAACIAITAVAYHFSNIGSSPSRNNGPMAASEGDRLLAVLWAERQVGDDDEIDATTESDLLSSLRDDLDFDDVSGPVASDYAVSGSIASDTSAPDWLIAALADAEASPDQGDR